MPKKAPSPSPKAGNDTSKGCGPGPSDKPSPTQKSGSKQALRESRKEGGAPFSGRSKKPGEPAPANTNESENSVQPDIPRSRAPSKKEKTPARDVVQPRYLGLTPRWWLATGLIMAFVGANLQLLTHIVPVRWFGLGLIVVGLVKAFYWISQGAAGPRPTKAGKRKDLAWKFIYAITFKGRLIAWFPLFGFLAILIDLVWNFIIAGSTEFLSQDWTMWALGIILMVYIFIPSKYGPERDFSLILILIFSMTMVLPMGLYRVATGTIDLPEGFVYWLLASPTTAIVNLTGAIANAHGIWITFQMSSGHYESLGISTGCAGLESLFLFISGFVAFVLVEKRKMDRRIGAALIIGVLTAYFANILRMTIIVLMGVHYGRDAMLATHENAGTLIFLGWIAVFWYLMYRFVLRPGARPSYDSYASSAEADTEPQSVPDEPLECTKCGREIDPDDVPEKCPKCGQGFDTNLHCEKCGEIIDPNNIPDKCPGCGHKFS